MFCNTVKQGANTLRSLRRNCKGFSSSIVYRVQHQMLERYPYVCVFECACVCVCVHAAPVSAGNKDLSCQSDKREDTKQLYAEYTRET